MEASARDINPNQSELSLQVSRSLSLSTSPTATFQSPPSSYGASVLPRAGSSAAAKQLKPFATEDIKILLLENVNQTGRDILAEQGYQVEFLKSSLPEDQLIEKIRSVSRLFIRDHHSLPSSHLPNPRSAEMCMLSVSGPRRSSLRVYSRKRKI